MAKKPKYPLLPRHIVKQQNNRYRDMKSLKWLSNAELQQYTAEGAYSNVVKDILKPVPPPSWHSKYDNY